MDKNPIKRIFRTFTVTKNGKRFRTRSSKNVHTDKISYKIYQPYHTPEKKSRKTHPKIPPQFDTLPADNEAPRHTPSRQRSTSAHPLPIKPQGNSAFPPSHPAQRRWLIQLPSCHKESQPFLPAVQRSADGSSNSRHTTPLATLPTRFNTSHGQCTASEGLLSRLTLQEGSCFLGAGNLRCFKKSRCLSDFRREFEIF